MNQCDINKDSQITNYIFNSNAVRQSGENIFLWFKNQAKMAELTPYY